MKREGSDSMGQQNGQDEQRGSRQVGGRERGERDADDDGEEEEMSAQENHGRYPLRDRDKHKRSVFNASGDAKNSDQV